MADQNPNPNEKKGYTVKEIEGTVKKFGHEIALTVIFIVATVFALVWGGAQMTWSILLGMIFAIIGIIIPELTHKSTAGLLKFVYKDQVTGIIFTVIGILVAIFLPPIIFALVGVYGGKAFSMDVKNIGSA